MRLSESEGEKGHEKKKLREKGIGSRPLGNVAPLNAKAKNHLLELANEGNLSSWRRWGPQVWNRESCFGGEAGGPSTGRRCDGADCEGMREGGRQPRLPRRREGRMPRGVPTRLRGRAWRAVKAQKPEGRGRKGGTGEGEEEGEGVGEWGESRLPLLPRECAASAARELALQASQGPPLDDRKDATTWGRDASQPRIPLSSAPSFLWLFSPKLKPQKGGGVGGKKKMAKGKGTFPSHPHTASPPAFFPTIAAPGRTSAPGRAAATSPLQAGVRPPEGGGGASPRRPLTCRGRGRWGCGGGPAASARVHASHLRHQLPQRRLNVSE